jgi:toxin ParE1/3/4
LKSPYTLEVTQAAADDITDVLDYSAGQFGDIARRRYEALITTGLKDVQADPRRPTSVDRPELDQGVRIYHLRHCRRRAAAQHGEVSSPRHLLVYEMPSADVVRIIRVLHDAMELERHIPRRND